MPKKNLKKCPVTEKKLVYVKAASPDAPVEARHEDDVPEGYAHIARLSARGTEQTAFNKHVEACEAEKEHQETTQSESFKGREPWIEGEAKKPREVTP